MNKRDFSSTDDLPEESLMSLSDCVPKILPPARDDGAFGVVEDLDNPPCCFGAEPVEVYGEPEGALDAACVEGGEEFGGADVDGPGGHGPPESSGQSHGLTEQIIRIRLDLENQYGEDHRRSREELDTNDFRVLADLKERWKVEAIRQFERRILSSAKRFAS